MVEPFVPIRRTAAPADGTETPGPMAVRPKVPDHGALGALAPFAADPAVTDLLVDGLGRLWLDRGAGLVVSPHWRPVDPVAARRLAVGIVASGGRHLDDATPCVDVRLPGGIRAHAVLPPVSTAGPLLSVRIARAEPWRLADLEGAGMLTPEQGERLRSAVGERRNLLICGPAGSGKTSLLAALLAEVPPTERIVTVEDVAELVIDHPHVVGLEARQPNADGAGGVGLARLVREALRMRPDRLVVGECRGAEIVELLAAMNTGHDGGAGTLHSTGIAGVGARLEALGALAGLGPDALGRQVVAAVDLVVHLARDGGRRRVDRIGRFAGPGLEIVPAG
ncbi:MAG TPA: ATPase, T2SS/T4P/T4SS family [Amnibacterium sp.]|uniref:CpaF family protein n=1 Tax=Amnibacterium sp. TaxID=1872496 RepID=UPI002F95F9A2